jgi:glycosyltransferase involved in cell wall biosynthesis
MGKLVVASDVGGHRELIRDGHNGHLFPAQSEEALAHCLIKLLNARGTWDEVIANGREYVASERNWAASVERYRVVYPAALERARQNAEKR